MRLILRKLLVMCDSLESLPEGCYLSVILTHKQKIREDWVPRYFSLCGSKDLDENEGCIKMKLGKVEFTDGVTCSFDVQANTVQRD